MTKWPSDWVTGSFADDWPDGIFHKYVRGVSEEEEDHNCFKLYKSQTFKNVNVLNTKNTSDMKIFMKKETRIIGLHYKCKNITKNMTAHFWLEFSKNSNIKGAELAYRRLCKDLFYLVKPYPDFSKRWWSLCLLFKWLCFYVNPIMNAFNI